MQIVEIAELMMETIEDLDFLKKQFASKAQDKASAISEYERAVAKAIALLKSGREVVVDGETVSKPPATVMGRVASGYCAEQKERAEFASDSYRNLMKAVDVLLAKLNAYQSIYKRLDNA